MIEKTAPQTDENPMEATNPSSFMTNRRGLLKGIYSLLATAGVGGFLYSLYRFLAPGGGASAVEIPLPQIASAGMYPIQYGGTPGMVIQDEDGNFKAFSLLCTHMACTVAWNPEKHQFHCPCHDALFDAEGKVLSGPAPAPLDRWKIRVRGDRVVVGEA